MRVLSLDWDYFLDTTLEERVTQFPDSGNENLGNIVSNMVWTTRYVDSERVSNNVEGIRKIQDMKDNKEATIAVLQALSTSRFAFMSVDSHKWLGEFLTEPSLYSVLSDLYLKDTDLQTLEIVNIDHHSDLYGNGKSLDCGNWLNKVMEKYPKAKLLWLGNVDSPNDEIDTLEYKNRITYTTDISDIKNREFDFVFLCRSDIWTPPHLDGAFRKFDKSLRKRAAYTLTDLTLESRWTTMEKEIAEVKEQYKKLGLLEKLSLAN